MAFFDRNKAPIDDAKRDRWTRLAETVSSGLRNFKILAAALKEIRDTQLYVFEFDTFADACREKWNISERHAARLIAAHDLADEIGPAAAELSERALRPLAALDPEPRAAAIEEAMQHGLSAQTIERAAHKRRRRKTTSLKPLRIRVPGGSIRIEPNRKSRGYEQMLLDAIATLSQRNQAA